MIGSQQVPYIYEDRISQEDFVDALSKIFNMSEEHRKDLGKKGRQHVLKNYNFDNFRKTWVDLMTKIYEEKGSWENRKQYKAWSVTEII
tara:strand:- start:281 stop:547 length:267 start_codon:yes stop_codon:yes gene_type:complete